MNYFRFRPMIQPQGTTKTKMLRLSFDFRHIVEAADAVAALAHCDNGQLTHDLQHDDVFLLQ